MRHVVVFGLAISSLSPVFGQAICPPAIDRQQSYGTIATERLHAGQQTADGGFIFGGERAAMSVPADFWVARLNTNGGIVWDRTYGGDHSDQLSALEQTGDGGFILGGTSLSDPGTNKSSAHFGEGDFWIVRTDANGTKLWEHSYGGDESDRLTSVAVLPDGGYMIGGFSRSASGTGNKTSESFGDLDIWVLRLDPQGNKLWERSFGGTGADLLAKVKPTADGGFILVGNSDGSTNGNKTTPAFGGPDVWVIRLDTNGVPLWQRSLGGTSHDFGRDVVESADGRFFVGATSASASSPGKDAGRYGLNDFWLIHLDADGTRLWDRTFGGPAHDELESIALSAAGQLILGGSSMSPAGYGTKYSPHYGGWDYWAVAVQGFGYNVWEQSFGGDDDDQGQFAIYRPDGAIVLAGSSQSDPGGNKTTPNLGDVDFWVVQLRPETPGDCDGDGVSDERDVCPTTPVHSVVNAWGCTLNESCPCERPWGSNAERVSCVQHVTAELVSAGLITPLQRDALIAEAMQTNCPPSGFEPESVISFGFTNVALGNATLSSGSIDDVTSSEPCENQAVHASGLDFAGHDGMAVVLGQSESGLFFYPDAPVGWGSFDPANFMLGKAFGRMNGTDGLLLSAMRAAKTYYEYYPVHIDLSPLGPASLTIQVLIDDHVALERTMPGAVTRIVVRSSVPVGPRGNPFWRMPDGTVGALIELTEFLDSPRPGEYGLSGIEIPGEDEPVVGNRVFIRANNPANVAEFVSRFEVYGGGGLPSFSMVDGRFPFGGLANKITGPSVFVPSNGTLTVRHYRREPGTTNCHGVIVALPRAQLFQMETLPITLNSNEFVEMLVTATARCAEEDGTAIACSLMEPIIQLTHRETHLELTGYLGVATNALAKVYRYGQLVGEALVRPDVLGTIVLPSNGAPLVAWSVAAGGSNAPVSVTLGFAEPIAFRAAGGPELTGDLLRVIPGTSNRVQSLSHATFRTARETFTITGEHISLAAPPLAITTVGTNATVSWTRLHHPFMLESAASLNGTFARITNAPALEDGVLALQVPLHGDATRFFRLRGNDQ